MIILSNNIDGYGFAEIKKIDYKQSIVVFDLIDEVTDEGEIYYPVVDRNRYVTISNFPYDLNSLSEDEIEKITIIEASESQKLESAKANKKAEIENAYESAIKAGLTINGIAYPVHDEAVERLNVVLNGMNAKKSNNNFNGAEIKYIIDNNYSTQTETADNYFNAIIQIIDYREQLHFNLADKKAQIKAATTISELEAVTWN